MKVSTRLHKKKISIIIITLIVLIGIFVFPTTASRIQNGNFYGRQLNNSVSKQVYKQLTSQGLSGEESITCYLNQPTNSANREIYTAIIAYYYDYPEKYWIDDISNIRILEGSTVEVDFNRYQRKNGNDDAAIANVVNSIVSQSSSKPSHYERLKSAHDLLASYISYGNIGGKRGHHLTGAFSDGVGSCEAYSKAFKVIAEEMGYQTVVVAGTGQYYNGGRVEQIPHMWNYVMVEGSWYGVDVTWDDAEYLSHDYFLVGSNSRSTTFGGLRFAETHVESPLANGVDLQYPFLSADSYR